MTCIAGIVQDNTVWMGCDTMVNYGGRVEYIDTKLVKKKNIIMGFSGSLRDINLIKFGYDLPEQDKKMDDYEYMATVFTESIRKRLKDHAASTIRNQQESGSAWILIGFNKRLYYMTGDFSMLRLESNDYHATGSGMDVALGSLFSTDKTDRTPKQRIKMALEAAEKFTNSVKGPFSVDSLRF